MFRRRSRGQYDPQQYNTGIPTRSATLSSSAAQNAFYQRQLGPSAAAEALRRHSLDQGGADEMRDFRLDSGPAHGQYQPSLTQPSMGGGAMRRNSLRRNSLSSRADSMSRTNSMTLQSPPGRRQSLTGSYTPQRTNSLTRSYQVVHHPPRTPSQSINYHVRSPSGSSQSNNNVQRVSYTPSAPRRVPSTGVSRSIQPTSVPPLARRNSLSNSDRSNSLTRTHTIVNRDSQGRTMSLTTTTVRHMGSFDLVSKKDVPLGSSRTNSLTRSRSNSLNSRSNSLTSGQLPRPQASFASEFDAPSIHSVDSELGGIEEEPDETIEQVHARLARLADDGEEEEIEEDAVVEESAPEDSIDFGLDEPQLAPPIEEEVTDLAKEPIPEEEEEDDFSESTVSDVSASPASQRGRPASPRSSAPAPTAVSGSAHSSSLLPKPSFSEGPAHRETSPARSALRNPNSAQKTKVSFGGEDAAYVYDSYEYEDELEKSQPPSSVPGTGPSPHLAAATAAARKRNAPSSHLLHYQQSQEQVPRRPFAQPQTVQKRPSAASLTGRTPSSATAASRAAQQQRITAEKQSGLSQQVQPLHVQRQQQQQPPSPWDSNENFEDAPSELPTDMPVPARSAARPTHSPILAGQAQFANAQPATFADEVEEPEEDPDANIHAQALALAQAQFKNQNNAATAPSSTVGTVSRPAVSGNSYLADIPNGSSRTGPAVSAASSSLNKPKPASTGAHLYRGFADDDDAASIKSESSFSRERPRQGGGASMSNGKSKPGKMRSLRQPVTPSMRSNPPGPGKNSRKGSLLHQAPPQLDMSSLGGAPKPSLDTRPIGQRNGADERGGGFRKYSLRNNTRPDPQALLATPATSRAPSAPSSAFSSSRNRMGNGAGFESSGGSNNFTSRIADSDSEDESSGAKGFFQKSKLKKGGSSHTRKSSGGSGGPSNGKLSFGDVFSPNTEVSALFKSRHQVDQGVDTSRIVSDTSTVSMAKPRSKKGGLFKRMFGKKE